MKSLNRPTKIFFYTLISMLFLTSSCANVRNTTSYATVIGEVLVSTDDSHGVEGVTVWIESDSESDLPYYGGDITLKTNAAGVFEARIFLGYETQEDVSGGFTFDPEKPQFVGDARVLFFYEDLYLDLGGGMSLELGKPLRLPTLYLTQFAPFAGPPE